MCWLSDFLKGNKAKPKIELLSTTSMVAYTELVDAGMEMLRPGFMLDSHEPYYYTKAEDWAEVFDYIYFKRGLPDYVASRFDCEDFGIWMKGLVSSFFGLNYFGIVFGDTPAGFHGWNLFRDEQGLIQFEPQTGKIFPIGEKGYKPLWVLV